jgi:hypothetical protein
MIYHHKRRLVVQKSGGTAKYTIPVVSAQTDHSYPFSAPAASIELIANDGYYDYISDIDFDDIVRLQVSNTYSDQEKDVWQDLHEGRIINRKSQWGTGTTATMMCAGHVNEANKTNLEALIAQVDNVDSGLLATIANTYLKRTVVTVPAATFSMPYSQKANQKFVKDMFTQIEEASGHTYYFDTRTVYNSSLNLSNVYIDYKPLPVVPTTKYAVIQGSPRLLSADFTVMGDGVCNNIIYFGATPEGGTQVKAIAPDEALISKYGKWSFVGTDTAFSTNGICQTYVNGLLPIKKEEVVTGTAQLMLTPEAKVGDLVPVIIGDIDVKGASVKANLRVVRVSHNLSESDATTTIQFGQIQKEAEDYTAEFMRKNRLTLSNFIS